MKKPLFTGVCTALVTPFLGGNVNYPMMDLLLRRQVDAGIEAVVLCGTTGESPTLSDLEKLEMFRRGKRYVGDSCKIIAGTGSNSTRHTSFHFCWYYYIITVSITQRQIYIIQKEFTILTHNRK